MINFGEIPEYEMIECVKIMTEGTGNISMTRHGVIHY